MRGDAGSYIRKISATKVGTTQISTAKITA